MDDASEQKLCLVGFDECESFVVHFNNGVCVASKFVRYNGMMLAREEKDSKAQINQIPVESYIKT
jgi:hypothetical protein